MQDWLDSLDRMHPALRATVETIILLGFLLCFYLALGVIVRFVGGVN